MLQAFHRTFASSKCSGCSGCSGVAVLQFLHQAYATSDTAGSTVKGDPRSGCNPFIGLMLLLTEMSMNLPAHYPTLQSHIRA